MATTIDVSVFKDGIIVLATAAVLVPVAQRLRVTPVVTFLAAGAILGPYGFAALSDVVPPLKWVTVQRNDGLGIVGELGVVALLFLIGIELSLQRLMTMRRLVFGLGGLQILLSAAVLGGLLYMVGAETPVAVAIGFSLALSSTAIVIELLSRQGRMSTGTGRASFSVLLMQDLAVVPLIFLVTIMSSDSGGSVLGAVALAFGQALLAIAAIWVVASLLLRPLFGLVAGTESPELFVAATLLVIVGSGLVTAAANMSMALGAFVAGLILAETEYRRAIMATVEPFKGLLLGVFFFSVGMSLDLVTVANNPLWVLGGTIVLIAMKLIVTYPLMRWFRIGRGQAIESTALLAPGGEFAFITIGLGVVGGLLHQELASVMLAVTTLSMLLIPVMDVAGRTLAERTDPAPADALPAALISPEMSEQHPRMIVVGYGRVGRLVAELLEEHEVPYLIVDRFAPVVSQGHYNGKPIFFGDATDPLFLRSCGIEEADAAVLTINRAADSELVVTAIRSLRTDIPIITRARDSDHARKLYELGASDAVPETIEASLQLSEASLVSLGVPMGRVIASIHEKRDEFRHTLQGHGGYRGHAGQRPPGNLPAEARPTSGDTAGGEAPDERAETGSS
jgi:CPA2 family monovalent cation:H+ antiporter-2